MCHDKHELRQLRRTQKGNLPWHQEVKKDFPDKVMLLQSWVVINQACDLQGILGRGSHIGKGKEVKLLGRNLCRSVWLPQGTFPNPSVSVGLFSLLGNTWSIYILESVCTMYQYYFLCISLALEGMFWNIPGSSTVYETENRAFVSDRARTAIYPSCNLGKHPAAHVRCSEMVFE